MPRPAARYSVDVRALFALPLSVVIVLSFVSAPARADEPDAPAEATAPDDPPSGDPATLDDPVARAKAYFQEGARHHQLGRFADALAAYEKAYEAKPIPAFLFNIAQCHYELGNWERAIFFYRTFVNEVPDAGGQRAEIDERLAIAEKKLAEQEEADKQAELLERQRAAEEAERARLAEQRRLAEEQKRAAEASVAAATASADTQRPLTEEAWFWPAVGGAVAVGTALIATATGAAIWWAVPPPVVDPAGTAGTIDARSGS